MIMWERTASFRVGEREIENDLIDAHAMRRRSHGRKWSGARNEKCGFFFVWR